MNIAIDFDDSLADSISQLILFNNAQYGTRFEKNNFSFSDYTKMWGGNSGDNFVKMTKFLKSPYGENILPISGSQKTLKILKEKGHNPFLVTGRDKQFENITQAFIDKYFPDIFSGIYHTNSYSIEATKIKKSTICKKLDASIIIDDDLLHVIDCANSGIKVLVIDTPWNQEDLPDGAIRVSSWNQILETIDTLE